LKARVALEAIQTTLNALPSSTRPLLRQRTRPLTPILAFVMNGDFVVLSTLLNKPEPVVAAIFRKNRFAASPRTAEILAKENSVTAIKALSRNPWTRILARRRLFPPAF